MSTDLRLTVAEYESMVAKGAFDELTQKIELINGTIVSMNPAGPIHDDFIGYLNQWSVLSTTKSEILVRVQSGIDLRELESRPEPDIACVGQSRALSRWPSAF